MTTKMHPNGRAFFLPPRSTQTGLSHYPHARTVPLNPPTNTIYISGTSSRRGDGSYAGHSSTPSPTDPNTLLHRYDVSAQTRAVLQNIATIVRGATDDRCGLESVVDATVFLVDMRDWEGMDVAWNEVFGERERAPSRTCVAVQGLGHVEEVVEIKCVAVVPAPEDAGMDLKA